MFGIVGILITFVILSASFSMFPFMDYVFEYLNGVFAQVSTIFSELYLPVYNSVPAVFWEFILFVPLLGLLLKIIRG